MQNRNVVPRGRPRAPHVPGRDAARTIEFDCSAVANLLDQQAPKPAPDLDAEIEVVAAAAERATAAKDRFAHTMKRQGAALRVEGSRPMLPLAAPPPTEDEIDEEADTQEQVEHTAATRSMPAVSEPVAIDSVPPDLAPRPRVRWHLPVAIAMVAASAVALVAALV